MIAQVGAPLDHLTPVLGSLAAEYVLADTPADAPVQHHQGTVDLRRRMRPGCFDEPGHIAEEPLVFRLLGHQFHYFVHGVSSHCCWETPEG
jgi:hypothetical protein